MTEIGNSNLVMARLDPERLALFGKLRKRREKDAELIRRAIDALAEKEESQAFYDNEFERLTPGRGFKR